MGEESELVTGEAVVLDLRVAKLASRAAAMLLDVAVQLALLIGAFVLMTIAIPAGDDSLARTLFIVFLVLVLVGYPVLFETLTRGRSLGKMALGLRVVRLDGGPIRFRHALTRGLAGAIVDFWVLGLFGAIAVVVSLCSPDGRRVGDFLAGTLVIRERVPQTAAVGVPMPPGLEHWASQLDLSRLPDDLALASRQFLSRFSQLRPEAAEALGYGLAQQMSQALATPVPPGVPAWAFLAAVLAERRNRDHARAFHSYAQPTPYAAQPAPYAAQPGYPPQTAYPQQYAPAPSPYAPAPSPYAAPSPPAAPAPENPFAPPS